MDTAATPVDEWNEVAWRKAERLVFKLQKRIYQATQTARDGSTTRAAVPVTEA
jgi:N-terminal domain of reverse transcriptase